MPGCHANPLGLFHTGPGVDREMEEKTEAQMAKWPKNTRQDKLEEVCFHEKQGGNDGHFVKKG